MRWVILSNCGWFRFCLKPEMELECGPSESGISVSDSISPSRNLQQTFVVGVRLLVDFDGSAATNLADESNVTVLSPLCWRMLLLLLPVLMLLLLLLLLLLPLSEAEDTDVRLEEVEAGLNKPLLRSLMGIDGTDADFSGVYATHAVFSGRHGNTQELPFAIIVFSN